MVFYFSFRHVSAIKINLGISSLVCSMINIGWGVCYFQLDKEWRDVVILAGIQGIYKSKNTQHLSGFFCPKLILLYSNRLVDERQNNNEGNAFVMLLGVVLPKIVYGLQNRNHSYPTKPWQNVGIGTSNLDDQTSHSSLPQPPVRSHQQHIYAIPSEYDRRSVGSEYNNHSTVM